jgi:hypothetical protein
MYIYKLEFTNGKVYIGQTTTTIQNRVDRHYLSLQKGTHYNKKVQKAYEDCKELPVCTILEEVHTGVSINEREIFWIEEYDAFQGVQGLNSTVGGTSIGFGEDHPGAKYTKDDYVAVLFFLAETEFTLQEVAYELGVPLSLIKNIGYGVTHTYLKQEYPNEYTKMSAKVGKKKPGPKKVYPDIRGPDGTIYSVCSLIEFAKTHKLGKGNAGLSDLISGTVQSVKGYCLASKPIVRLINVQTNEIIEVPGNKDKREFRENHNLGIEGLRLLLNKKISLHKNWKIYE